jgi:hypothetical protein
LEVYKLSSRAKRGTPTHPKMCAGSLASLGMTKSGGTLNTRCESVKRALVRVFPVIALAWLLGCAALYNIMRQPPETFARFMAKLPGPVPFLLFPFETLWTHARAGGLQVGDAAPDFSLMKLDKSASVQLSSLTAQGRPVVLIFGSYT